MTKSDSRPRYKTGAMDMERMERTGEGIRLALMVGLAIVIAASFFFWGVGAWGENNAFALLLIVASPLAIAVSIWIFIMERKKIASGLPIQDERSKSIFRRATSYSFYTTLYFVLFLSFLLDDGRINDLMTIHRALMATLAEMVIALFVFLGYFYLKGVPE